MPYLPRPSPLRALATEVAELLLPQRCLVCGRFGAALHDPCAAGLERADGARCDRCWRALPSTSTGNGCGRCEAGVLAGRRACFDFEGLARRAVLEAKFRGVSALLPPLARVAAEVVPAAWALEAIVPIPLHPARRRERGFNQAELIAEAVGEALALPVHARVLRRARRTPPLAGLGREGRARAIEGAFALDPLEEPRLPSRVLLVDDVTTTSATLEAAAGVLHRGGDRAIYGLTLAIED